MLSSFLIALREGVEAALVVSIVLVYLQRTGRAALVRWVWSGAAAAVIASLGVAIALEHWQISQDGFEGVLMLIAAGFVVTVIVWMNRVARHLKTEIEQRVESYAAKSTAAAGFGVAAFVFMMILREGAEMALILRAVELSSAGVSTWIGTALGLMAAVAVGVFFFKGTLRISIGRFFAATSIILIVVAVQLALTGIHELSEVGWLPSSRTEMMLVGPIVRNEVFFFAVIFGAATLLVLREWMGARSQATARISDSAERRRVEWEQRKQRRWAFASAIACTAVIVILAAEFAYTRVTGAPEVRTAAASGGTVRIPLDEISDSNLHVYSVDSDGRMLRFLVVQKPNGSWGVGLDACMICGRAGYMQEGSNVICRNCASAIYIPTVGEEGGCNPVPLSARTENGDLVIDLAEIAQADTLVSN